MSKGKHDQVDMLHGPLLGKLVLFALPLALSSILQQLFNAVDIAVLGQFATSQDQAAVGCTSGSMHDMTLMQARRAASWMEEEIAARLAEWKYEPKKLSGVIARYVTQVQSLGKGAVLES